VIHKASVDVNEEGTEAAAATAVIMGYVGMPPPVPVFRADHPFVFVIRHNESGSILFMGRVANPVEDA
jgi:serpin B